MEKRFSVSSLRFRLNIIKAEAIIVDTPVLHNIAILHKENTPPNKI